MFIKKMIIQSNGKHTVSLVESYRDQYGKPQHRTLKKYGILEDLEKEEPGILVRLQAEAKALTEAKEARQSIEIDFSKLQEKSIVNYGHVFLEATYRQLHIPEFISLYRKQSKSIYDLDRILQLLVFSRILSPSSKRKAYRDKSEFFGDFGSIKLEEVYKSLDDLCAMKDELTLHLHKRIQETRGRDCSLVFYDVTNYYFESENMEGLRQKGVSKENRETSIVQMGLFIDKEGVPITYELFPGNTNDMATMRPILEKIKKEYGLGKITIVADKGNNTGENLAFIDNEDDYYIISQRIRARGTELADIVLDQEDYEWNPEGTFKSKSVERDRVVKRRNGSSYTITEHLLCFWSQNEENYQRAKRGHLDERIEKFIENPSLLNASNSFGIKKYFKKVMIDKKTGEVLKAKATYEFNQEKYERDLALDGYYCIVTNDLSLEPLDIIHHYHQLSKIEESFKVTKTDLEGRPVYVWKDDHIKGHFLTCYLALVILRLLQLRLEGKRTISQIIDALKQAKMIELEDGIYKMNRNQDVFNELANFYDTTLDKAYYKEETLKQTIKNLVYYNR
ncbi:MAG: IS1634 family transposase [Candidatus Izemoplasmatales bacterium]|nr:IS1634 family transposase [Candidatus Izemoplasmatales bacterium]